MQIAEFWGIFIEASEKFARRYAELDEIWYAKLLEARANEKNLDDLKEGYGTYLDLFRAYRNTNFWENEEDWEWFFYQYLKFLTDKMPEQICRDGLGAYISVIIKMQVTVENSGWAVDYRLYDEPMKVWGGQSWISKFQSWKLARGFTKRVNRKLGFRN